MKRMRHLYFIFITGISSVLLSCTEMTESHDRKELKRAIAAKSYYEDLKEQRINKLTALRQTGGGDLQWEYRTNRLIAEEFSKFNLDSAIHYTKRNLETAAILGDRDSEIESTFQLAVIYADYGLFLEGIKLLDSIRGDIPENHLPDFYRCHIKIYDIYMSTIDHEEHKIKYKEYCDSLENITGEREDPAAQPEMEKLCRNLSAAEKWSPDYASTTYYIARYWENSGQIDSAKHYYTLSAISDIYNSNRDQGSMSRLAMLYYKDRKYSEAFKYANSSIKDALKGKMNARSMRISEAFQIINDAYLIKETKNKWLIIICLTVAGLSMLYVFRQNIRLKTSELQLKKAHNKIQELNTKLVEHNTILLNAYSIQEKYISNFFEISSMHLKKLEKYQHRLRKMVVANKIEDLHKELKSNEIIISELHEQLATFDKIFLDIYPTFIDEFNSLLKPDQRIITKPGEQLNTELRIYALMRIGFDNCSQIADFLRCTVPTIYTYRAKTRSRAMASREEFEEKVMKIGNMLAEE